MNKESLNKARCDIAEYLRKHGPSLSSDIVEYLQSKCGLTAAASRQRLSRASGRIKRLSNIGLPDRACFFFLEEEEGSELYYERLYKIFIRKNSNIGIALQGVISRGGYVHEKYFAIISGAPQRYMSGHLSVVDVFNKLIDLNLLKKVWKDDEGTVYCVNFMSPIPRMQYNANCNTEKIVAEIVQKWLMHLNFCVNVLSRFSGSQPSCNSFCFDIVGRARLRHFYSVAGDKCDAFSVCDMNIAKDVLSVEDVQYYLKKIDTASYSRSKQNFIPFLFAYDFTRDCIAKLKKHGVVHARIRDVFGKDFFVLLQNLSAILTDISGCLHEDPERIGDVVSGLLRIEGRAQNLRSIAFQSFVAQIYGYRRYDVEIDKNVISPSGRSVEIDVFADSREEIVCVECKAFLPHNNCSTTTVNQWLSERLCRIVEWKRSVYSNKKTTVIFWVTTNFDDPGSVCVPQLRSDISFILKTGHELISELKAAKFEKTINHFNEHFVKGYT